MKNNSPYIGILKEIIKEYAEEYPDKEVDRIELGINPTSKFYYLCDIPYLSVDISFTIETFSDKCFGQIIGYDYKLNNDDFPPKLIVEINYKTTKISLKVKEYEIIQKIRRTKTID